MSDGMEDKILAVLAEHGRLPVSPGSLGESDDLYAAGMTSHASVNVMIALEDTFDVEFLDSMLKRSVFESVDSIAGALGQVGVPA